MIAIKEIGQGRDGRIDREHPGAAASSFVIGRQIKASDPEGLCSGRNRGDIHNHRT
jgi:hypothetical protein